jgi:hypothetical protein
MRTKKKTLRMKIKTYLNGIDNEIMNYFSVSNFDLHRTRGEKY